MLQQYQIVSVDQFRFIDIAEDGFDLAARFFGDEAGFVGAVVDQAARDVVAVAVEEGDDRAVVKG